MLELIYAAALLGAAGVDGQTQGSSKTEAPSVKPAAAAPRFPQPRPPFEAIKGIITSTTPKTKADRVDQERLTVRRLDLVDENGTIRLSLSGDAVNAILDGVEYKRSGDASGIIFYDEKGSEKGGMGYLSTPAGGAVTMAMDYPTADAVGIQVLPDKSVRFLMNAPPPEYRYPELGGARIAGVGGPTRVSISVAADGTPQVSLADDQARSRVRMTVTKEGYGAIEFLDAQGKVVQTLAPEAEPARAKRRR